MVGEEKTSLRKRLSKSREDSEENEDQRSPSRGSLETASNGRINLKQLMAKKIQLTAEAEELKPFFMKEVGSHFDDFVNSLIEKSASLDNGGCAITSFSVLEGENNHRAKDFRAPPEHGKIFILRQSLLDELFEVDHIRTIYHMFIALLILFILSTLVVDYIDEGRLVLEFSLLSYAFGKLPVAMWTWCTMFLSTLGVPYFLFQRWARGYSRSTHPLVHSLFHCFLFMVFQIGVLGLGPTYVVLAYTLPPASRCIVILEQIRFVMKAHSFVRENVPRVLNSAKEKSETIPIPTVNQYLYFLFAPTLIYRDNYPRTPTVRWGYVAMQFLQVFGCFFYVYYIFERLCAPLFRNIKQEPFSARVLVLCVFNSILPGVLVLFLTFFAFLHCWLNAFAEMLRFGDRMFYKDWWNSTSYANYYRTWNVVVHDWLYYYAYKDFLWFFTKRFKSAAMLAVFAVSAVVHEYALAICLNFFYPVLFVLFMFFGSSFFFFLVINSLKTPVDKLMFLSQSFSCYLSFFCCFSYAALATNHSPLKPTFLDYIRPRSWTCRYVF
uniref:O-acyltransferase n=1 Tax=Neovison vison TaxID=452646 RepID=A0A8C7AND6_NEOVI